MQRPYQVSSAHYANVPKHDLEISEISRCRSRLGCEEEEEVPSKLASFDWNSPMKGSFFPPIPPLLPSMSYSLGMLLSRLPSVTPPDGHAQSLTCARTNVFHAPNLQCSYSQNSDVKLLTYLKCQKAIPSSSAFTQAIHVARPHFCKNLMFKVKMEAMLVLCFNSAIQLHVNCFIP